MSGTICYAVGIVHLSVCSDSTDREEILAQANRTHPTGLDHGWAFSDDATFSGGQPNPCPCNAQPDTHTHYLLAC